jgi:hypothetical protein
MLISKNTQMDIKNKNLERRENDGLSYAGINRVRFKGFFSAFVIVYDNGKHP